MTVQITEAGAEARSIMRWAWQDPQQRAAAALETIHEMAAAADPEDLPEIQDAASMLTRLAGTLQEDSKPPGTIGAQLSRPLTILDQIELAAIHGRHIPGTAYTFRHGWIPLIGQQLNDKYPEWMVKRYPEATRAGSRAHNTASATAKATVARERTAREEARRLATVPNAQKRVLTPEMDSTLRRHAQRIARAQRAASRAASPATPHGPGGSPTTQQESLKDSGARQYVVPLKTSVTGKAVPAENPAAVQDIISPETAGAKFPGAIVPRSATPEAPPNSAREAAAVFSAAAPTPAHQAAVAAGQAVKTEPGTVGAKIQQEDPALMSLAAPGANMAALKAYIDARVAAEVAQKTGQITPEQHDDLEKRLSQMHRSQQALIAHMRKTAQGIDDESAREDRIHLAMYSLFTVAGVALAIAGLVFAWPPIAIALVAAAAPLSQIVHDYVRSD